MGHTFMLVGMEFILGPSFEVILAGNMEAADTKKMLAAIWKYYIPNLTVKLWTKVDAQTASPDENYERIDGRATVYVCQSQTCMPATADVREMLEFLGITKTDE